MNPQVLGQLGVEGAGEPPALADEYGLPVDPGQDLDPGTGGSEPGGADEDAFHAPPLGPGPGTGRRHEGIDLGSIGVALRLDVDESERRHRMIARLARQQDCPGAGAEQCAARQREGPDRLDQAVPVEPFRDRRALAARKDQRREAGEVSGHAHPPTFGPAAFDRREMLLDVSLECKHTDHASGPRSAQPPRLLRTSRGRPLRHLATPPTSRGWRASRSRRGSPSRAPPSPSRARDRRSALLRDRPSTCTRGRSPVPVPPDPRS